MPRILILARSGFGKTTSYCGREKLGIKGLDPKETYVIQCVGRGVPNKNFKLVETPLQMDPAKHVITNASILQTGNRICVEGITGLDRFYAVANLIQILSKSPFKNIIVDDFNYLSQDYYMANAMKGGWDTPKQIGYGMGLVFDAFKTISEKKNLICCAHYEEYKDKNGDSISYKFKTLGKMTDDYITPEGKFDVILFGKSSFNNETKQPVKEFVKEYDGEYPAKDSLGVLDELPAVFTNDLSLVVEAIDKFYN